jgi:predicted metal-dependent HD superfamily phosphohydrolase
VSGASEREVSELRRRWSKLLERGGLADPDGRVFARLIAAWTEPHRRYHTPAHLLGMLEELERSAPAASRALPELDVVAGELAAFFHDAVYHTDRSGSEIASAELAAELLPCLGAGAMLVMEVWRLVELTAAHRPEVDDIAGAWVCDADLIVLAATAADYERYLPRAGAGRVPAGPAGAVAGWASERDGRCSTRRSSTSPAANAKKRWRDATSRPNSLRCASSTPGASAERLRRSSRRRRVR